jgi:subtilisin family serine protease
LLLLAVAWLALPGVLGGGAAIPDAAAPEAVPTADDHLGVRPWHAAGFRGQGVKVAILDSGFAGYRDHLGRALPERVRVRSFRRDQDLEAKDSQHGILCAEIVHALAPDAEVLLVNWEPERPDQFLDAVRWAREEGANVLSCSIIMPTWSDYEGHGPVHAALARLLGPGDQPGDALFFASAGNTAQRHWAGPYRESGGWHAWTATAAAPVCDNPIRPWGSERVSVELCGGPGAFEVSVLDVGTGREVGRSPTPGRSSDGLPHAVVSFLPEDGHTYTARVRRRRPEAGPFHLVALGAALGYSTRQGSIPFPGDGPEVVAVGAVDAGGRRWPYSSCGPKEESLKPDLVAPVPFPSSWRPRPFTGTSAAAPQAAAVAAVLWSRHPDWTAREVRDSLQRAARPGAADLPAWETGHGCVHLP